MRTLVRVTLTILPLLVLAARVQSHGLGTPHAMAKEVARILSVVNVATSRRSPGNPARNTPLPSFSGDRPSTERLA
jgi:hypothetical protein